MFVREPANILSTELLRSKSNIFESSNDVESDAPSREDQTHSYVQLDTDTLADFQRESSATEPQEEREDPVPITPGPPYAEDSCYQESGARLHQHSPVSSVSLDDGYWPHRSSEFEYSLIRRYSEVTAKWYEDLFRHCCDLLN